MTFKKLRDQKNTEDKDTKTKGRLRSFPVYDVDIKAAYKGFFFFF